MRLVLPILALAIFAQSCGTSKHAYISKEEIGWELVPMPVEEPSRVVFAVGDAGAAQWPERSPLFNVLRAELEAAGDDGALVYLGDNVYPAGLPKKDDEYRDEAEVILKAQLSVTDGLNTSAFMVPGNHDWNHWSPGGRKAIKRMEDFVQDYWGKGNTFVPSNGCADPVRVKIEDNLILLFIDSQWWLHNHETEKKMTKGCEIKSRTHFLEAFEDLIRQNKNKQVMIFMHHPMHTNGHHGGYFTATDHLFPFTQLSDNLYIPLPIIGSILPLYRKFGGVVQDVPHPLYQELINDISAIVAPFSNFIFVAGHEHSLQYHQEGNHHFVVSGSGTKDDFAKRGEGAYYVRQAKGFAKFSYYTNGEVWLEFILPNEDGTAGIVEYRKQIVPARAGLGDEVVPETFETLPDSMTIAAGARYKTSGLGNFLLGEQYREAWQTPVTAPVINLETYKGGLTPIQKGGGQASNSLRMETADGKQYALRSIDKNVVKAMPAEIRDLSVLGVLQDQISAIHPYSAFILPKLADAAGVYHTNPELVYLKHQPALGAYNELFPEELYLFEERPAGVRHDVYSFGAHEEIIGYIDLLEKLKTNHKAKIDQEQVLRSRLFDQFIHDWDRHDDQWRWARFDGPDGTKIYRPIPRDRDQAFYKFEGVLPWFTSAFIIRKFATMKSDLKHPYWESFNARYFDRYFLTSLDRQDWITMANDLQSRLTDDVIDATLRQWPKEIYEIDAPEIEEKLRSRRDKLETIALRHYDYISKAVSLPGTDQEEFFDVERLESGDTRVRIYDRTKKGKKDKDELLFERTFIKGETKEIRLYGLGGDDEFKIDGKAKKGIIVRVIGGEGNDVLKDESKVAGPLKMTRVYDTHDGMKLKKHGETSNRLSEEFEVNEYDREDFLFNTGLPVINFAFNTDDRIFIGGGWTWTKYGFRSAPYKRNQTISGNWSPATNAFNLSYEGDFIGAFREFDFFLKAEVHNPYFVNYFGSGNNTNLTDTVNEFNWVRINGLSVKPMFKKNLANNRYKFMLGPILERYKIERVEDRFAENSGDVAVDDFAEHLYGGAEFRMEIEGRDNKMMPAEGVFLEAGAIYRKRFDSSVKPAGASDQFASLNAALSFYITFGANVKFTVANRVGIASNLGDLADYPFFLQQKVGGTEFLRGYRNDRFYGKTAFSHNIDLRINLATWNNRHLPMDIGLLGGFDYGGVWNPGEDTGEMHRGYTAGMWFAPLSAAVLNPFATYSDEQGWLFNFLVGFSF
ncbi:MAG: hypothetical protein ACI959_000294 [Limisphaerales bacterium]|jgi:hypothetical protein